MRVSDKVAGKHSEQEFEKRLQILSDSGAGIIHIRTKEIVRATLACRKAILVDGGKYKEWTIAAGFKEFDVTSFARVDINGDGCIEPAKAIGTPMELIRTGDNKEESEVQYFVYINPHYWLDQNPLITHHLQEAASILPTHDMRIIMITPDIPLPECIEDISTTIHFETPGHGELLEYLDSILSGVDEGVVDDLSDEEKNEICYMGAGMTKESFDLYVSEAIVNTSYSGADSVSSEHLVAGVNTGKTEIVNRNDLLELCPTEDMADVGGMENLKEWVRKRALCYTDEARDYGIEAPKGMVFVGVPGSGKSLAAKAVANELGVPLVRLDFGRMFNSLVGASEAAIRTALGMVAAMAPCVLFCDEIDKGLGGIGGSGDAGTSNRVLGTFLTWLQENTAPVFTMVTANNIIGLPPELLRRGRFDAIFATGMPTEAERLEVLEIHLRKRGWDPKDFKMKDKREVVTASRGYVPAEIEAAVADGLVDSYSSDETFSMDHVVAAIGNMVPLSKAFNEQIQAMTVWAHQHAVPASKRYAEVDTSNVEAIGKGKRVRTRVVDKDKH